MTINSNIYSTWLIIKTAHLTDVNQMLPQEAVMLSGSSSQLIVSRDTVRLEFVLHRLSTALSPVRWRHPARPGGSATALLTPLQGYCLLQGCFLHHIHVPHASTSHIWRKKPFDFCSAPSAALQAFIFTCNFFCIATAHILIECSANHRGVPDKLLTEKQQALAVCQEMEKQ